MKTFQLILCVLTLLNPLKNYAQKDSIYVRIDDLDNIELEAQLTYFVYSSGIDSKPRLSHSKDSSIRIFGTHKSTGVYWDYFAKVYFNPKSHSIKLPVDEQGSYIQLKNVQKLNTDTIIIPYLKLYSNCIADTTFILEQSWEIKNFYEVPNTMETFTRWRYEEDIECIRKIPDTLSIVVNDKEYRVNVERATDFYTIESRGHGFSRKTLFNNPEKSGNGEKFYFIEYKTIYFNKVTIEF